MAKIKLTIPNGYAIYNEEGKSLELKQDDFHEVYDLNDEENEGINILGIYNDDTDKTERWKAVYPKILKGTYKLPENAFIDNGQVIEDGRILRIEIL